MGKNLLRKFLAYVVMVMGAVIVFSACSKDPYKNMRLALDTNEVTITYDSEDSDKNTFTISATVSGVKKNVSKDVEFVVGDNSIVSPIGSDYKRTSGDKTTATFVATPNGGKTYIDVLTLEGNQKQRVNVNVIVPIESMSFAMATLPIERGVKTDITSKFDGVTTQIYDRLSFVPQNTTQKDVILTTDASAEDVTIDGNFITVNSDTLKSFNLTAVSKYNSDISASINCTVLDTIDTDKISIKELIESGDSEDLTLSYESGKRVYLLNLANVESNANDDKQKNIFIDYNNMDITDMLGKYSVDYIISDQLSFSINPDEQNGYVVYGGSGKTSGLVNFSLNYKGFENLFAPKYIALRVNVSTFPDKVFFSDGQEQIESVKVYQNYHSSVDGATAVLNIFSGTTSLSTQTAYLSAEASGYGAIGGIKLWYYSAGVKHDIGAKTAVRHGEKIYISFNAEVLANFTNEISLVAKSTVNNAEGRITLDLVKGVVAPVFTNGSVIKMKEADEVSEPNTFLLSTVEQDDVPYLVLGSASVALSECDIKLQNNGGVVTCVYDEGQGGFVISVGKLPSGVTDMTVSGTITTPNGMSSNFSVLVYANVNSDTLALRIGNKNYTFVNDLALVEPVKLAMQTGSWFEMKLVRLLDFALDANGEPTTEYDPEGRYEVLSSIPKNINFENISYGDGEAVVSVDASNKLKINSTRNIGKRIVNYTLSSTSYDPSLSDEKDYMYISFEISVEARLNGFGVSGVEGGIQNDGKNTFTIITDKSILHPSAKDQKTESLMATARPSNTQLDYKNLAFEVHFESLNIKSSDADKVRIDDVTINSVPGRKYTFDISLNADNGILGFVIFASIEQNKITMTFSCDELKGRNSASIKITLIYTQTFTEINGEESSYTDRSTIFEGSIKNAEKVTKVSFDNDEITFNVNQLKLDKNGNVTSLTRANGTVDFSVTPSVNLAVEGFYLYYRDTENGIIKANIKSEDQEGVYNINGVLEVTVGDGYVGVKVLKYIEQDSFELYLVPIDMSDELGNVDKNLVETSTIPAKLTVSFRNGTKDNRYAIKDAYDLQFVNEQLDAYYEITNDIIISDTTEWTPIGVNAENQFTGNIIGNNYKISGLVLNRSIGTENASKTGETKTVSIDGKEQTSEGYAVYYGLFGYIGMGAEISDVTFENFQVYVEYNGENLGVVIEQNGTISGTIQNVYVDVYVGGFAGLNLGKLSNITVVDDTNRGYSSIKGNILNTLRMTNDDNVVTNKGVVYQPVSIYAIHSNSVFAGGMVGLNAGEITGGKSNVSLFVRDKQDHPTLKGVSSIYAGGVAGANIATSLTKTITGKDGTDTIIEYTSGQIVSTTVYSLINATLVDPVFKGMIRNEESVLGGVVGLNVGKSLDKNALIQDVYCQTIIIGLDNIGGVTGVNYGLVDNVEVLPHLYGKDYIGGIAGKNANSANVNIAGKPSNNTLTGSLIYKLSGYTYSSYGITNGGANYYGLIYHSKVKFVDTMDEISFFNTSMIGSNYVGGLVGYSVDLNADNVELSNINSVSQYTDNYYATIAYSSVKSYFTREYTNINDVVDESKNVNEVKFVSQLHMDFEYKVDGSVVFDRKVVAKADSKFYGDIVILAPSNSDVKTIYVGGLVGYSDGSVNTSGNEIKNSAGGAFVNVYFDAIVSNTYNVDAETDTAIIGGLVGKANGILFVYNANILGSVKNAKCVGGFVGDSSELFDRLDFEGKKPYSKDSSNFYVKGNTTGYDGKFNINNSYTILSSNDGYVQNFAYIGERVENKIKSGTNDNSQVNTIKYSTTTNTNYSGSGDDENYYYVERRANNVTIREYKDNEVKSSTSTKKVEKRKVLKYVDNAYVAIQKGYEFTRTGSYETDKEGVDGYTNAGIFQSNGIKTYYTKSTDDDGNEVYKNDANVPDYKQLYYLSTATNLPEYKTKNQLASYKEYNELSDDAKSTAQKLKNYEGDTLSDYLYDENGIAKYKMTKYYISTGSETLTYYIQKEKVDEEGNTLKDEDGNPIYEYEEVTITKYDCSPAYSEVTPNYVGVKLAIYNNGVYNSGNNFYWGDFGDGYVFVKTDKTVQLGLASVTYDIYEKTENKTKFSLAKESAYTEYVVGNTIYSDIKVDSAGGESRQITFTYADTSKDSVTIAFNDKNMYHLMLDCVVNNANLNNITNELGQAEVEFSYNRLTASNSFYVGFETYLYNEDGKVLSDTKKDESGQVVTDDSGKPITEAKLITFTEADAKNTALTLNETSYSYYPSTWHYTNINYSDLVFKKYARESNLVGYHVQYEDSDDVECMITEYEVDSALIKGVGFVNPKEYITDYNLDTYAYSMYEGGENGLVEGVSTSGKYTYHNLAVNRGLPLAFGKYQGESETELNLVVDIAPESLSASSKENEYKVDNVIKNADGSLQDDTTSRPIAIILDYTENEEKTYDLLGGTDNVIDIELLPQFVGYGSLNITSDNNSIVEVKKEGENYKLVAKSVGYAIVNISSMLNNSLSCDVVVLVKEATTGLIYKYSTPNGVNTLENGDSISILKNNTSIFSVFANNDITLKNFGVEYTIKSGSAIINGKTYTAGSKAYVYGVSNSFKVDEEYEISARPFYLYEVTYNGTTYAYRKYVDALTGNSKVDTESITYTVSPNSFAYNITAPGNIQAGIANQTSFEIQVQSNDSTLVPFKICFGEKDTEGKDIYYVVETTLNDGVYESLFVLSDESKIDTITVNKLNITLVKTTYDQIRSRHTIKFVADVDTQNYTSFTSKTNFEITCNIVKEYIADEEEKSDKFTFTLIPFQVENVRMSHYTKFWYDETSEDVNYETEYKSYKYASNKIIPGYNSLLQVDITPSYGQFDYVVVEIVGTDGSIIRQLVESQKSKNNAQGVTAYYDFPYFELVNNASNVIKVTNKYSSFDDSVNTYDPSLALAGSELFKWDESGTLLFALNLDSKYENSTVVVNVKGYSIDASGDTLQFSQNLTLEVIELPRLSVTWDRTNNEFSTGPSTSATLNIGGELDIFVESNADIKVSTQIGKVEYQNGKYVFSLKENLSGLNVNNDYPITFTATKTVDGAQYSTQSTIYVRPVLFLITGVSFVDGDQTITDYMTVYYNEEKAIKVKINARYDKDLLDGLKDTLTFEGYDSPSEYVEAQLEDLAEQVWSSGKSNGTSYSTRYFGKNTLPDDRNITWLTEGDYSLRGYILSYVDGCFKIRIASSSVKDTIYAYVGYDYTNSGIIIFDDNDDSSGSIYTGAVQKKLEFSVLASSRDENPLPIKSVDDFKNMVAGESYILLNDLVLSKWEPIEALFKSFDGNGYTITITSFGNVEGMTDIGLFSTIGTDDSNLNYYTTVQNLYIDICPVTEGEDGTLYMDKTAMLEVNIGSTEDVHVGVLAGTNYGIITNVNVVNNASNIRNSRKTSLSQVAGYSPIIVESFTKYFDSDISYDKALAGSESINIDSDNMVDTFSIITSDTKETQGLYVGGLVGQNSSIGYITNSSVEGVNVKGIDYVAGFASRNLGYISSSYFKGGSVISNDKQTKANSATAGFVAKNESGKIQFSYVLGAETEDVYGNNNNCSYVLNNKDNSSYNSMSTYIDKTGDMLVLNSNSEEYSASDKRTGKIQISLTDYASYAMYKQYNSDGKNKDIANLRALGSAVYTNNYASGFVGENSAYISNCYANILVSGTYGAGFAYQNSGEIESSYAMSSIKNNNENYYPFTQSKSTVEKSFYLYVNANDGITNEEIKDSFSKANDDVATSLYAAAFGDYNTFTSWGFNSDYAQNNKLDDGVWFIPAKSDSSVKSESNGMKKYLRESSYTSLRPELVSANIYTMSIRYYVSETGGTYRYNNVDEYWSEDGRILNISQGSLNNPLLITTASDFNTNLKPATNKNGDAVLQNSSIVRMVHDIAFNEVQTATTFTTDFIGNLEGNGLSIDKLRIIADASSTNDKVTYLGLFRSIQSETKTENVSGKDVTVTTSGTVRNLNINIEEITGSNINFVGVLAGVIDGGKIYNIKISSTYDNVRVEGLNAVGGLSGMIVGDADIVNITNNISVKANAINQLNIFDPKKPNVNNTQFRMFVPNEATKNPFDSEGVITTYASGSTKDDKIADAIKNISYVGGIAGIIDVNENPTDNTHKKLDFTDRIRQCYVNESVTLSGDVVGGLAGYVGKDSSLSNSEFIICENTDISADRIGGAIVGHNEGTISRVVVKYYNQKQVDADFYNAENNTENNSAYYNALDNARSDSAYTLNIRSDVFSSNAHYIGGIIGANFGGTLKNSYSRLNVVNIYSAYAGGLIGLNVGGELSSVYTTGSVKGYFATGGIIGISPAILFYGTDLYLDDQSTAVNNDYARRYIDNISDVLYSLCESMGAISSVVIKPTDPNDAVSIRLTPFDPTKIQTTYLDVVGANIWRYSDTSVYRSEYYITQRNSWIGVFVGYMSDVSDTTNFEEGYEYLSPIKSNGIESRLAIENTFFKQTYVYNSNDLIAEIGNIDAINISSNVTDLTNTVNNTKESMYSGIYKLTSTTGGITTETNYRVSRLRYYGSLRSLNEIVSRSYSMSDANSIWSHIGVLGREVQRDNVKQLSIYFGFDTFNWNGTQIDSENNTIINEVSGVRDVFPEIVNNLKPKIINVMTEDDLRKMGTYLDSTFILQNDITLSLVWTPVGTEDKPFTGELRSADGHTYSINNVCIADSKSDYFGFVRVANGAILHDFNLECATISNNVTSETVSSIAGGILVGLADEDENENNTKIKNVAISLNNDVKIFNTQYVGGVVGYGKKLTLSDVTLEKYEEPTVATLSSTEKNAEFFTSMYKVGDKINYAFGGLVGKFDDNNTTSAENTLSVKNIDFYVNYSDETTKIDIISVENRTFTESKVYVGGVFGLIATTPDWEISTSGVKITANMPEDTIYDLYVGGAVGYSSVVDYTSGIKVDTNITATLNNDSSSNPAYIGGVFGYISDGKVSSIANKNSNIITLDIKNANNNVYVGGVVGYTSSTEFEKAESNTKSTITTTGVSTIYAGGFVGCAENSTITNVDIDGSDVKSLGVLKSKIDLITLKDDNDGNKNIYIGGIAGNITNTNISGSNVLGNINHAKDESTVYLNEKSFTYSVYIGGAVGYLEKKDSSETYELDQVSADVDIIDNRFTKKDGTFNYGGLVGNADTYTIQNSYAVGKIYSVQHIMHIGETTFQVINGTYLGGLVGNGNSVTFNNCYSATQFVLPNSENNSTLKQSFWESTEKGGIIGHSSGECTSTNVYYVKDFVPFSNGVCGTGVSAENLASEIKKNGSWSSKGDGQFYPIQDTAYEKSTNVKGGGQNPIVVTNDKGYTTATLIAETSSTTTNHITSAQTVYVKGDTTGSNYNIELDDRMSTLVIVGESILVKEKEFSTGGSGATVVDYGTITNNGTILGGIINNVIITNNGNIIGVRSKNYNNYNATTFDTYTVDNALGFIYASGIILPASTASGIVINSVYVTNGDSINGNNLNINIANREYTDTNKSATKNGLYAQNVEIFDRSDNALDLDIDKYWSRVSGVNDSMLVPKWMYKDHYYDDNYNDTYGWYTSADVNGTTKSETIYTVSSAEGLAYIAQQVNTGELENVTIELSADIDLKGKVWTPIGITGHPFNGTFDGKGHTISNMSVVGNTYNGLFGVTNGATIQDLLIKDAQVASSGSNDYTAILVGYAKGTLEIEKVAIEDAHICAGNSSVAGMVGFLYNCTLKVNNAYVVIAVNGERVVYGGFSFVVNKGVGTNTITINNMYGANIGLKSTSYEIVSQGQTLGSQTHPYYISNCGEITIDKTYVVWEDSKSYSSPIPQSGITKFKSLNELRTETDELFKDKDNKTLWGTTWTRQYSTGDPTKTKNYGLPILSFAQEYWIDEGKTTSAVTESGNTYTITSASQLAWVAYQVNEKNNDFSGKTIQVTKDIDLAGKIWTPIGITNEPFKGSFELKEGFTISNMTCYGAYSTNRGKMTDSTTSYSEGYDPTYGGLFGLVEDSPSMKIEGNITNFVVSKVQYGAPFIAKYNVSSSTSAPTISVASIGSSSDDSLKDTVSASSYAGGVVGSITGTESVKVNVVAQVKNVSVVANWHAGGVVGCAKYATIYNSSVDGATYKKDGNVDESAESNINILSVNGNVGGIAGYVTESTIFNCWANKFSLNTTNNYGDIGGIVGYIGSTNLSALQVTAMTAKVNGCLGGIVGSSTNSTIQNATVGGSWSKYDNKIMHSKDGQYYGGVVGYMYKTNLSEVTVLGNMSVGSLSNYKSSGLVVGYIDTPKDYSDNSKYIVDNIYLNINYNESIGGGNYLDVYKTYIFGFGNQDTNKYPGLFDYTMFSMKNKYGEYVNCITYGDCTYSSAWKYNSYEFTNSDGLRGQMSFYSLKSASGGLYSKFCMTNANNLQYMLDNVETVDGHVVITPYKLDSVNVSTNAGMEYLAEWWTYRHKLSSNDTTIYIIDDIQDYSADSIGNEKFPFVGSIYGRSQNNINDQVRTLTFKNIYSIYGIVRYATKINASNITLAQSDKKSQGYGISGSDYVGGLVGRIVGSTEMIMENITSYITVKGRDYVGGIIGAVRLTSGGSLTMTNCNSLTYVNSDGYTINNVADKSSVKGRSYVGGIIGAVNDSVSTGKVTIQGTSSKNAVVQKDIEATGSRVGSVVGDGKYVTIKYYDIKPLKYKQDLLVDEADWLITVRKSGETTSTEYFGGVAGYIENSTIDNVTLDGISVSASIYNKATGLATDTNKPNCVGGAVGYATASTIQNVTVKNDAGNTSFKIAGKYYVGGLVGSASNVYNNAGKFENSVTLENNTVSNAKVEGFGSIGGLVGRLSNSKVADNYLYSITVKFNNISKNTVSACTISLQQTTEAEISEHDYVGGLIGEIKTDSYYTGRIVCADCGAPVTVNKNGNVTISSHYVSCPTFGSSSELEQKTPSLTMTNSGDNVNTVESSTLIYTKNVDMDEGWFGNYKTTNSNWDNRLSTNRWDNTIPKSRQVVSFSDAKQMAMGNYAFRLDGTNYKNWQPPTYKGYGRNFWYENVYTYNTWFGPSSGTSQAFSDLEDITTSNLGVQNCVYLSTFGTTSGITLYSGSGESSRTLPDLNTNYGVQSFFNSARGYNPNNMPNVGTLYGTNNITDNVSVTENVNIKKSSTGGKVLKDRLTHWAYIAMQDNDGLNRYGLLIIEWSYYIDSDQRKPSKYDFISDVQKEFISEANQRIEVKFRYDVKVDESSSNRLNDSYSTFTINWYSADQVSYPLRSLKDLFWESYNSSTGKPQEGRTNKGLINEFIMAVYDKDTSNKSLYCGNTWKVIKYDGSESECTLVNSDFGKIEQTGGYCIYANVNKSYYHRLPNNDSSYQKYTPDVYYYGYAFGKEERIIKQKTVMNNK